MTMLRLLALVVGAWVLTTPVAIAGIPAAYAPIVVGPVGTPQRYEFDLTAALRRAQRERKRLYVYLGADNCPFCRKYEAFLQRNASELAPHFAKDYLVVDLRSTLAAQASRLYLRIGEVNLPLRRISALNRRRTRPRTRLSECVATRCNSQATDANARWFRNFRNGAGAT